MAGRMDGQSVVLRAENGMLRFMVGYEDGGKTKLSEESGRIYVPHFRQCMKWGIIASNPGPIPTGTIACGSATVSDR